MLTSVWMLRVRRPSPAMPVESVPAAIAPAVPSAVS